MTPPVVLVAELAGAGGGVALAAGVAVAGAPDLPYPFAPLLVELAERSRPRGPTLLASDSARGLEEALREAGPDFERAAARGRICALTMPPDAASLDSLSEALGSGAPAGLVALCLPAGLWVEALDHPGLDAAGALLRAELPAERSLVALCVRELRERGVAVRVAKRPLGAIAARRALAGVEPGGASSRRLSRLVGGVLA